MEKEGVFLKIRTPMKENSRSITRASREDRGFDGRALNTSEEEPVKVLSHLGECSETLVTRDRPWCTDLPVPCPSLPL